MNRKLSVLRASWKRHVDILLRSFFIFSLLQVLQVFVYLFPGFFIYLLLTTAIIMTCSFLLFREVYKARISDFLLTHIEMILMLLAFSYAYQRLVRLAHESANLFRYALPVVLSLVLCTFIFLLIKKKKDEN
jgi:uncharacterized protein YacL